LSWPDQQGGHPHRSHIEEECCCSIRKDIIGIILVKELILIDKGASIRVGDLKMRSAPHLRTDTRLYDMLRLFETGRCHMAVLEGPPGQATPRSSAGGA
jgi:metal transporter CNNM